MVYITLFALSLAAATILPLSSETVLLYDLYAGYSPFAMWITATAGNVVGAWINYYLGSKGEKYLERKGYLSAQKIARYKKRFLKYGGWLLWLSWAPLIGDPITMAAGVFGYDMKRFVLIVSLAKGARYALVTVWYLYGSEW